MTTLSNAQRIGSRLRRARKRKGLTQEKLSELTGIGRVHISHIECGRVSPSMEKLILLMDSLEAEPNEIFCDVVKTGRPFLMKENESLFRELDSGNQAIVRIVMESLKKEMPDGSDEGGE
ncbi:MAG: helix-turn-helix domain-containing protein [Clostridiales bacterium]|nr:helix-turn-helix domain-containing protein [Clostridiales bacterium]